MIGETTSKIIRPDLKTLLEREWLATNGLGGFASSTLSGAPRRRYHGLLVASLPSPFGRTVMLNYVDESLILSGKEVPLSLIHYKDKDITENLPITEFRREIGFPIWRYEIDGVILEKTYFLTYKQNTLQVRYEVISSDKPVAIKWAPYLHFRTYEQPVNFPVANENYAVNAIEKKYEIKCENFPILRLYHNNGSNFTIEHKKIENVFYETELFRGYEAVGHLTSPGYFVATIEPGQSTCFVASTESWNSILSLDAAEALLTEKTRRKRLIKTSGLNSHKLIARKLVLAADQFVITPTSRYEDMVRLQAIGEEVRTIIAGYPWFTDWGRDTMISLEGLTLATGRFGEAHSILRTFSYYIKDGLIPNMFPDGEKVGLYHTADATLWFFHAIERYIHYTGDEDILDLMIPKFREIINAHINGTHFGIKVDSDGLLTQGALGYQLTWMDAKVDNWVVTPRRGKAVEINALWYNALKLFEMWTGTQLDVASKCYKSFNEKFWYKEGEYLYDVIDGENGNDSALRPNQIFSISLKFPVLEQPRWQRVIEVVRKELLTPVGLRTLAPSHPDFKKSYNGDLRSRDAAYHQGTVWPWLLGHFIDAWLKVHPNDAEICYGFLKGLEEHLTLNCIGTIGEIFDACEPYTARGCFAQAWSVAEMLRSLKKISHI